VPGDRSLFPANLAEETLRTLALLFPQSDHCNRYRRNRVKRAWFRALRKRTKKQLNMIMDEGVVTCGTLREKERQINEFRYWRDRLMILKEAFDLSTPSTASQWWFDRRSGVQWSNFWVPIAVVSITAFIAVVQCVEAAIQIYKAYHP